MKEKELLSKRLFNQHISFQSLENPGDLVSRMGAVQAQDYAMSKWAVALRLKNGTDKIVEDAINEGIIIRTHVLRPTWHLVHVDDIRWMLELTAPFIRKQMVYYDRQLGIEKKELLRSVRLFEKSLEGAQHLSRPELEGIFTKAKFDCKGMRFGHLLMHAELQGLICSGARKGKQNTYALFEERVPEVRQQTREESLAKLTLKYFQSHGPATVKDFTWWSGLAAADAGIGIALIKEKMEKVVIGGETFYFIQTEESREMNKSIYLLPNYDEYTVAYSGRDAIIDKSTKAKISRGGNPLFYNIILVNGKICGTWKREVKAGSLILTNEVFEKFSAAKQKELLKAENKYRNFAANR